MCMPVFLFWMGCRLNAIHLILQINIKWRRRLSREIKQHFKRATRTSIARDNSVLPL